MHPTSRTVRLAVSAALVLEAVYALMLTSLVVLWSTVPDFEGRDAHPVVVAAIGAAGLAWAVLLLGATATLVRATRGSVSTTRWGPAVLRIVELGHWAIAATAVMGVALVLWRRGDGLDLVWFAACGGGAVLLAVGVRAAGGGEHRLAASGGDGAAPR